MSGNKEVIGLSWQPKLDLFSSNKNQECKAESSSLYNIKSLKKQVQDTAGKNWFDMPSQTITPELKKDLQLLKLRSVIDPKRHYKKDSSRSKKLPNYFQVGTVIESASEFFTGRLTKKERKATLAEELLSDGNLCEYRKRKVREIEEENRGDKWKRSKHKRAGQSNKKKRGH